MMFGKPASATLRNGLLELGQQLVVVLDAVPAVGDAVRAVAHGAGEASLLDRRPLARPEQFDRLEAQLVAFAAEVLEGHLGRLVLAGIEQAAVAPGGNGVADVAFELRTPGVFRRVAGDGADWQPRPGPPCPR